MLDFLDAILKAILFAGILSCSGVVFAEATLGVSSDISRFSIRVMRRGAIVTIVAALAGAFILLFRLGDRINHVTLSAAFLSVYGAALCLQIGGVLLLLTSTGDDPFDRRVRVINALVATFSFAFHGHAASGEANEPIIAVIHTSAAAWWIGSLWLLYYACSRERVSDLALLVLRFSSQAVKLVGVLLLAGLILSMTLISSGPTPLSSPYLKFLGFKVVLVAVTLGVAIYNKYRLTPRLVRHDAAAASSLRNMIRNEMILIAAVLTATAFLTTYSTPFVEYDV